METIRGFQSPPPGQTILSLCAKFFWSIQVFRSIQAAWSIFCEYLRILALSGERSSQNRRSKPVVWRLSKWVRWLLLSFRIVLAKVFPVVSQKVDVAVILVANIFIKIFKSHLSKKLFFYKKIMRYNLNIKFEIQIYIKLYINYLYIFYIIFI